MSDFKEWEYRADTRPATTDTLALTEWLNSLGERGWELVAIESGVFYFKREAG